MAESDLEMQKDALIQGITEAFSRGVMEMDEFERAASRLSACASPAALAAEASSLGLSLPVIRPVAGLAPAATAPPTRKVGSTFPVGTALAGEAVALSCASGHIRKAGQWVRSKLYRLSLRSSSVRLDLREYAGARGFRLSLDIDAISSVVRLVVPRGFEVEEDFAERHSSVVKNRPRDGAYGDNLVLLTGSLKSSVVKIRYR
jgi:hypothetical protein